jgi:formiminotetrahydrofolate cyclodeaminase
MVQTETVPSIERTVAQYAAAVASPSPTPGGGSVVATVASLSAGLAEMVLNVTLAGKAEPDDPQALQQASDNAARLRLTLLELAAADEAAYAGYRDAAAMPRATDEEKNLRRQALERALVQSANVPLEIARSGVGVLGQLLVAAQYGTKHALSDVSAGAMLAESAIRGALITAGVNADLMRDPSEQKAYRARIASLTDAAATATSSVLSAVQQRNNSTSS